MSTQITVGVTGHVDHGKTALVRALTGMETDRLAEERERGLSIVPGFAWFAQDGVTVDLIDVPGHEDFIRNMVAGASGIDAIVLVVDAREGVMPQTREHLAIASLLGVQRGIAVLARCDRVGDTERAQSLAALRQWLADGPLPQAPLIMTSAETGEGLAALREALLALADTEAEVAGPGAFHLPVDRVFSLHGHGTVVTGTIRGGSVQAGDAMVLMPAGRPVQVRGLQSHGQPVDKAGRGARLAVNLRGVDTGQVARGDALAAPGALQATDTIDAALELLPEASGLPRHGGRVRLLAGTAEVIARVRVLDRDQLQAGAAALVQMHLDATLALAAGDRFILRSESPVTTIGGGRVLDCRPGRHRRRDPAVLSHLQALAGGSGDARWRALLEAAGNAGLPVADFVAAGTLDADTLARLRDSLDAVLINAEVLIGRATLRDIEAGVMAALAAFHAEAPTRRGLAPAALADRCGLDPTGSITAFVLQDLRIRSELRMQDGLVALAGHDPFAALPAAQRARLVAIESAVRDAWMKPPEPAAVLTGGQSDAALAGLLREHGRLVRMPGEQAGRELLWHGAAIEWAERALRRAYPPPAGFTVSQARQVLDSTRKYVLPLLNWFDARGRTRRKGDLRVFTGP